VNNVSQLGIRLHLDCGGGEVRRGRGDLVIGLSLPPLPMAEAAKLFIETLAFLQIVMVA
jgi:hypothetical protein